MSDESSRALLQELPLKSRAPHPRLSSEQLRSAQRSIQSCVTSASSQFLTPPVSGPRSSSPPPKREAEDYVAAKRRHTGKRRSMHKKLHSKAKERSETSSGLARLSASRSSTLASSSSQYDAPELAREGDTESSFASRFLRSATFSASHVPLDCEAQGLSELDRAPTGILTSLHSERSASPAAKSLQRLKQVDETKNNTNLRRLSENFSSTMQLFRSRTLDPKNKDINPGVAGEALSSRQRRPAQRERKSSKPSAFDTLPNRMPSIITLRRATLESTPIVADDSSSNIETPGESPSSGVTADSKATGAELVAFHSTPLAKNDTNIASSRRRSMYDGHEALQAQLEASQTCSRVFDLASGLKVTANKASAALTRTDVHITPGTFHDEARTVKSSKASNGSPRRLSVVQIVSYDTVNAIIWREEESPSSSSSTQTPSPRRTEPDSLRASIHSRHLVKDDSPLLRDAAADQMYLERQGNRKLSGEVNMFDWSWGKNGIYRERLGSCIGSSAGMKIQKRGSVV